MAEAQAKKYTDIFINSAPLECDWPKETVLIANRKIYQNAPGRHAERVFLDTFEETRKAEGQVVNMYLNYSPCDECSTEIIKFLDKHSEDKFNIRFAHVYYYYSSQNPERNRDPKKIRKGLKNLDKHKNITLKAIGEKDWKKIMKRIRKVQRLDELAQGDVEEWSMTKGSILGKQGDLEQNLDKALNGILHKRVRQPVKDIMTTNDPENWGTEVGDYFTRTDKRYLHNKAMQVLYNHGEGSLTTIVNAANGEGYAFLLLALRASGIEGDLLQLLRKRIIADFVADKEFRYIIDEQIDGEANAAVGNEADAAAAAE